MFKQIFLKVVAVMESWASLIEW